MRSDTGAPHWLQKFIGYRAIPTGSWSRDSNRSRRPRPACGPGPPGGCGIAKVGRGADVMKPDRAVRERCEGEAVAALGGR
ncbi:MAG: hypothetical protein Fur0039_20590 [Rhodocyclaceae bacterium]